MIVRPYDRARDYSELPRIFSSGFHHVAWPILDGVDPRFVSDLIESMATFGDFAFVVEEQGKAQGILWGAAPTVSAGALTRGWPARGRFAGRLLSGSYKLPSVARRYGVQVVRGLAAGFVHHPRPTAEVTLLSLDDSFRGRGFGAALMTRFWEHVHSKKIASVQLLTHSVLSWQFYERMGFSRIRTWRETAFEVALPGKPVEAYIYERFL